jgi:hypothetical protein
MRNGTEVSVYSLVFAIESEKLGDPHAVLVGEERFVSRRIRHKVEKAVWEDLNQQGLASGNRLDDEFRDALATIQRAGTEYYGWITGKEKSYGLLVAASGRDAFAMVRTGESAQIWRVRSEYMVDEVIARLPEAQPGRGKSISVLATDYTPSTGGGPTYLSGGQSARHPEARRLEKFLQEPRLGGGKLYAATRDHTGRRQRSASWVTFIDFPHGRWLTYLTEGAEPSINAVPATHQVLAKKLAELSQRG